MKHAEPMHKVLVWGTSVATPAACLFEWVLRTALFPRDFEEMRMLLRPYLVAPAWGLAVLTLLCALFALALQSRMTERSLAKLGPDERDGREGRKARTAAFLVATTFPQLSALASTFAFTFGAPFLPVAVSMAIATAGVGLQGVRAYRG